MSEIPHAPESNHNHYYQHLCSNRPTNTHSRTLEQSHRQQTLAILMQMSHNKMSENPIKLNGTQCVTIFISL